MNNELLERIKKSKEELEYARDELKRKFIGIDVIIDDVINKMSAWYMMPELCTRPLIINLWGLTGVGKTDLIRSLAKLLNYGDKYVEIQMSSKAKGWDSTIQAKLMGSDIEPGQPGILLLDEIQRFRTVDEQGHEIRDYDFQDVWMLLSDGRFSVDGSEKDRIMNMLYDILYRKDRNEPGEDDDVDIDLDDVEVNTARPQRKFKMSYYRARDIKQLLKLEDTVEQIMTWEEEHLISRLNDKVNSRTSINSEVDYSKLLIFISGNLDEAFREAIRVTEADRDADDIHNRLKEVNMLHIKKALLQRFKPEQIARFGNTHVIYPSLSRDAFEQLIDRRLSNYAAMVRDLSGERFLRLFFDDSIKTTLYNNGVFPLQGVRPLLSTVDEFFNFCMPTMVIKALKDNVDTVAIVYENEKVIGLLHNQGNIVKEEVAYVPALDKIRSHERLNVDAMYDVAVHEAGHAVAYMTLYNRTPQGMAINLIDPNDAGWIIQRRHFHSKDDLMKDVIVAYGGIVAETMVFGEEFASAGSAGDVDQATQIASSMYRQCGLMGLSGAYNSLHASEAEARICSLEHTDNEIEHFLRMCRARCEKIITNNTGFIRELALQLVKHEKLSSEQIEAIAKPFLPDITSEDNDMALTPNYKAKFEQFFGSGE